MDQETDQNHQAASAKHQDPGNSSLIRDIFSAFRGFEMDYTSGPLGRAILLLAIPMILELVMESVFAVVDVYWVSSLGSSAVATIGLTESLLTLIYAVAIGLSMGTTALVARRIGEKKPREAGDAAVQAIILGVITSLPIAVAGILFAPQILDLMGGDEWTITHGSNYFRWMLGGNVVIMLLFIINAIYRGAGDAIVAMWILWLANGINLILDPALIFGWGPFPEMGIQGAAVATNTGRGIAVVAQLFILLKGAKHIKVIWSQVKLQWDVMWGLIKTSLGGIGQFIIATSSWIGIVRIISEFGSDAVAGYTIAIRIMLFTFMPAWGLSNAAATLVGQNLGAGQPKRAEKSVWITGVVNMAFMTVVAVIYILFSETLVGIFAPDQAVLEAGAQCLFIMAFGYPVYAWGMVMPQAFNGAGDTWTPTWINLFCFWLLEIPLAYLLALQWGFDEPGVYGAIVGAEALMGITAILLFTRGKWKNKKV